MATPAPACKKALADATARWPNRNRASDGILGDAAHKARKSDHNIGLAFDLTHDPDHGVNCNLLCAEVINDPRVTYVIWQGEIFKTRGGGWVPYRGVNPHNHHMHVSIKGGSRDDLRPWPWSGEVAREILKLGSKGEAVRELQTKLVAHGYFIEVDGNLGPLTERSLRAFQRSKGLAETGQADASVWAALEEK